MAKSFKELKVWNRAIDLTAMIYGITADFPASELYALTSQMRRAAVSIPSNIAEGSARSTRKDFKQFVNTARGSNYELQTQLVIAGRLRYSTVAKLREAEVVSQEIGQMLSGLSRYLSTPRQQDN